MESAERPPGLLLGRYYCQGHEFIQPSPDHPTVISDDLHFGRELISDVDDEGREYRWEALVFSSRPMSNVVTAHCRCNRRRAA